MNNDKKRLFIFLAPVFFFMAMTPCIECPLLPEFCVPVITGGGGSLTGTWEEWEEVSGMPGTFFHWRVSFFMDGEEVNQVLFKQGVAPADGNSAFENCFTNEINFELTDDGIILKFSDDPSEDEDYVLNSNGTLVHTSGNTVFAKISDTPEQLACDQG